MNEQLGAALSLLLWPVIIYVGYKVSFWSLQRYLSKTEKE